MTGAPQSTIVEAEAESADEARHGTCGGAEAADVAGVRRDLRLPESDVEYGGGGERVRDADGVRLRDGDVGVETVELSGLLLRVTLRVLHQSRVLAV